MCCGHRRTTYHPTPASGHRAAPRTLHRRRASAVAAGRYRYTGPTRLTVRGPASGLTYDFAVPGAVLTVDPRDAAALAAVPGLEPAG